MTIDPQEDLLGVRANLVNKYKLDDSKIGWKDSGNNGGTITYDGYDLANINENNIKDGRSYMTDSDLINAVTGYDKKYGTKFANDSNNTQPNSKYQSTMDSLLNKILGTTPFTYNPTTDPAYQAYLGQTQREGARASEDAMATGAALSGGRQNSWSTAVGADTSARYAKMATDSIPEFQDAAYGKYRDGINDQYNQLDTLMKVDDTAYARSQDEKSNYAATAGQFRGDFQKEINNVKNDGDTSNDWKADILGSMRQDKIAGQETAKSQSDQAAFSNALDVMKTLGYATPEIANMLGIPQGTTTASYKSSLSKSVGGGGGSGNSNTEVDNARALLTLLGKATPEIAKVLGIPEGTTTMEYEKNQGAPSEDSQLFKDDIYFKQAQDMLNATVDVGEVNQFTGKQETKPKYTEWDVINYILSQGFDSKKEADYLNALNIEMPDDPQWLLKDPLNLGK